MRRKKEKIFKIFGKLGSLLGIRTVFPLFSATAEGERRGGRANRCSIFFSRPSLKGKRKRVFNDIFIIVFSFFRGFHPRLETLNRYAVLAERFASVLISLCSLCSLWFKKRRKEQATNGSGYNTSRAAARVGSYASPRRILSAIQKRFRLRRRISVGQATNGSGYNTSRAAARIGSPAYGGGGFRISLTAAPSSWRPRQAPSGGRFRLTQYGILPSKKA